MRLIFVDRVSVGVVFAFGRSGERGGIGGEERGEAGGDGSGDAVFSLDS